MGIDLQHIILTRYNLGLYGPKKHALDVREWMDHRLLMFATYTVPSILGQNDKGFVWVVLVDSLTPADDVIDIKAAAVGARLLRCEWNEGRFGEKSPPGQWLELLRKEVAQKHDFIATTRLDNDDALSCDYTEKVRRDADRIARRSPGPFIIDAELGYVLDYESRRCYYVHHPKGTPFLTKVEPWSPAIKTCYSTFHYQLARTREYHKMNVDSGMWLEVVHDRNISNKIVPEWVLGSVSWNDIRSMFSQ